MMWFYQYRIAQEILAERAREADRVRLARLASLSDEEDRSVPRSSALTSVRRNAARVAFVVSRSANRLAEAIDVENETARAS